jgi:2-iminobutanoate/2-iminopropanoate deaminase
MPKKRIISPSGMGESAGPFSRAVQVGDHLYIAGTTALSHISGDYYKRPLPATIEEQTRLTLENIKKCVEAAGGTMDDIFKVVIQLEDQPISTCYKADLMREDILVEIEAVAVLG